MAVCARAGEAAQVECAGGGVDNWRREVVGHRRSARKLGGGERGGLSRRRGRRRRPRSLASGARVDGEALGHRNGGVLWGLGIPFLPPRRRLGKDADVVAW